MKWKLVAAVGLLLAGGGMLWYSYGQYRQLSGHEAPPGKAPRWPAIRPRVVTTARSAPPASRPIATSEPQSPPMEVARELTGARYGIAAIAFSPDGSTLAGGGVDGLVCLWEVPSGRELWHRQGHAEAILTLAFSPDGTHLITSGKDRATNVWDAARGNIIAHLERQGWNWMGVAGFWGNGKTVATGSGEELTLWDVATEEIIAKQPLPGEAVQIRSSRDGRFMAVGMRNGDVQVWDTRDNTVAAALLRRPGGSSTADVAVYSTRFLDVDHLAICNADGLWVWEWHGGRITREAPSLVADVAPLTPGMVITREDVQSLVARSLDGASINSRIEWAAPSPFACIDVSSRGDLLAAAGGGFWVDQEWSIQGEPSVYLYAVDRMKPLLTNSKTRNPYDDSYKTAGSMLWEVTGRTP